MYTYELYDVYIELIQGHLSLKIRPKVLNRYYPSNFVILSVYLFIKKKSRKLKIFDLFVLVGRVLSIDLKSESEYYTLSETSPYY